MTKDTFDRLFESSSFYFFVEGFSDYFSDGDFLENFSFNNVPMAKVSDVLKTLKITHEFISKYQHDLSKEIDRISELDQNEFAGVKFLDVIEKQANHEFSDGSDLYWLLIPACKTAIDGDKNAFSRCDRAIEYWKSQDANTDSYGDHLIQFIEGKTSDLLTWKDFSSGGHDD